MECFLLLLCGGMFIHVANQKKKQAFLKKERETCYKKLRRSYSRTGLLFRALKTNKKKRNTDIVRDVCV